MQNINKKDRQVGVVWDKTRAKWKAEIFFNGKNKQLGRYDSFSNAVAARKKAEKIYFNP